MRKKIIGLSVMIAFLAMLCAQPVAAQPTVRVDAWTDKPQYDPGEKGKLKISVLNALEVPVEIYNISITYPWLSYDAEKGEWVGNETIEIEPAAMMSSKGGKYYKEVEFTIPNDGRATGDSIDIYIATSNGTKRPDPFPSISVASTVWPTSIVDLDMWMTSLTVVIVICTIILAIVVFLSTRKARHPRVVAPPPPPPSKAKS